MKQFITLKSMQTGSYKILELVDSKFYALYETLEFHFYQSKFSGINILDWFIDDNKRSTGNEWISIDKERGAIALYDTSDRMSDETISKLDPLKRFEISLKNFAEIIYQWDVLRISKPNIILLVIHEDNHVSLETDPVIIKKYQDAGYAFDINKTNQGMKEYTCFEKSTLSNHLDYSGLKSVFSQLYCLQEFVSQAYLPSKTTSIYKYHDQKNDMLYIGYYDELQGRLNPISFKPPLSELGNYVTEDNSCKINTKNFIAFITEWLAIEELDSPFALIYRDEHDWIHCQAFQTQEEMEQFIVNYKSSHEQLQL